MSLTLPRFAIINTFDAPCLKMVCELVGGKYYYMARAYDPRLKSFDGMLPDRPTSMEDFGFDVLVVRAEAYFSKVRPSTATYEDGKPRVWQDQYKTEFTHKLVKLRRKSEATR